MKNTMLTPVLARGIRRLISRKLGIGRLAGTILAACTVAAPMPLLAATIFPPAGSTAFIAVYEFDSGGSVCPLGQCTIVSSAGTSLSLPSTTFSSTSGTITASGSTSASALRTFGQVTGSVGGETDLGMQDTYTVHGSAAGPFDVTVTLHATGTAESVFFCCGLQGFNGGQVSISIGTLDINPTTTLLPTVDPFDSTTHTQQGLSAGQFSSAPFSIPIDLSVSYTTMVSVGDVFDIAYGMNEDSNFGIIDLSHTATISFSTPNGVFLTSSLGGEFGNVPTSATPVPAALPLFATGLGALGLLGWRRKRKAHAAV